MTDKEFAKQLYKEIYPNNPLNIMSGHHPHFDRFMSLAQKIKENKIETIGKL